MNKGGEEEKNNDDGEGQGEDQGDDDDDGDVRVELSRVELSRWLLLLRREMLWVMWPSSSSRWPPQSTAQPSVNVAPALEQEPD
ncbi:hypothetical protein TWF730_003056 [Orbilia blumenaviensis]|uniref:Uncharacterized protein n=1 Tax=Orbilia blumenaviensis TaxID=1796055 RepID=A0AAV9UBF0_9PEZI